MTNQIILIQRDDISVRTGTFFCAKKMIRLKKSHLIKSGIEYEPLKPVISKPGQNRYAFCSLSYELATCLQHIHEEQRDALLPRAYLHGKHDNNSVANARQTLH